MKKYFLISGIVLLSKTLFLTGSMAGDFQDLIRENQQLRTENLELQAIVESAFDAVLSIHKNDYSKVRNNCTNRCYDETDEKILANIQKYSDKFIRNLSTLISTPEDQNELLSLYVEDQINGLLDSYPTNIRRYFVNEPIEKRMIALYTKYAEEKNIDVDDGYAQDFDSMVKKIAELGNSQFYIDWREQERLKAEEEQRNRLIPAPPPPPTLGAIQKFTYKRQALPISKEQISQERALNPNIYKPVANPEVLGAAMKKAAEMQRRREEALKIEEEKRQMEQIKKAQNAKRILNTNYDSESDSEDLGLNFLFKESSDIVSSDFKLLFEPIIFTSWKTYERSSFLDEETETQKQLRRMVAKTNGLFQEDSDEELDLSTSESDWDESDTEDSDWD